MVLAAVAPLKFPGVVGWRRGHAQHLPRLRVDGHNGTNLSFEHALGRGLELNVDAKGQVTAGTGTAVEPAFLILALDAPVCITQEYLYALLAAQLFLVTAFHTQLADIVASLVVLVILDVGG